jgi:hypothetical protein
VGRRTEDTESDLTGLPDSETGVFFLFAFITASFRFAGADLFRFPIVLSSSVLLLKHRSLSRTCYNAN